MTHLFYLMSGNIDPDKDSNIVLQDVFKNTKNSNPNTLIFTNEFSKIQESSIFKLFSKYTNNLSVIENEDENLKDKISNSDIVYFHGGNPYKYSMFFNYREQIKNVPIKIGNSAGAIFLSNHTFYVQKDDYIIAIPNMLDFINLHVFAHSEIHKENIVFNYLLYENPTNILKLYGESCLKIEYSLKDKSQKVFSIMGNTSNEEKIELFVKNISYTYTRNQEIDLLEKLVNSNYSDNFIL